MVGRFRILIVASRFLVAIAMASLSFAAVAAPAPLLAPSDGIVVARGEACSVLLVAASYDDPGADDAEFIELRVVPSAARDAGAPPDAGASGDPPPDAGERLEPDADVVPTLAACGLAELDLVDGANGSCKTYRRIPLGAVAIPADGWVVLCPAGSAVDASARCDVTTAGLSSLRAGWLQNGPNDGLRFTDGASSSVDVAYEGRPACFGPESAALATESGAADGGAADDDVNVACGGRFVLLPQSAVPLRSEVACPAPGVALPGDDSPASDAGAGDAAAPARAIAANSSGHDAGWVPERAPPPVNRGASRINAPLALDAGQFAAAPESHMPPKPPGCVLVRASRLHDGAAQCRAAVLVAFVLFGVRRLRQPRRSRCRRRVLPGRARCDARCGWPRRRSP